jgi:hypothetical protein
MFPKLYKYNKSKNNFLYTQVLDERFKKTQLWKFKRILMFTDLDKNRFESLKREDSCRKQLERIKNILKELIMMLILTFEAISATKLRNGLNLLLMMRSRKWKKNLKVKRSSKEMVVMIVMIEQILSL